MISLLYFLVQGDVVREIVDRQIHLVKDVVSAPIAAPPLPRSQ